MDLTLQKCKYAWDHSLSDTDRFKTLFLVIKYLKSNATDVDRKELFQTIGLSFLQKLFHSDAPDYFMKTAFRSVAVAILAGFTTDREIAADRQLHRFVPILNDVLIQNSRIPDNKPMIMDTICCLEAIMKHGKCHQMMFDEGIFSTLAHLYSDNGHTQTQILAFLMYLLLQNDITMSEYDQCVLNGLMRELGKQFLKDNTENKFELCEQILHLLLVRPDFQVCNIAAADIRDGLRSILQSKISTEQRETAIKLSGLMVAKFGSQWFIEDVENSRMFFVVLVQIISVEVKMLLDDNSVSDISGNAFLLTACYRILECIISTMINENWFHTNRNCAGQLLKSLKMAMLSVINFIKNTSIKCTDLKFFSADKLNSEKVNSEQILLATLRVLCCWLAEETFALQEEVCEILPFVLSICEQWFSQINNIETDLDPLRFLLPPLCHLTADENSRKVLLDNNALPLLLGYMEHHWVQFEKSTSAETETVLTTLCGVLLNIVVLESHLITDNEDFCSVLKHLFAALPNLPADLTHLVLKANFSVLGLFIARHNCKRVKSCETSFYRFLSASIKFLWDAYQVEDENDEVRYYLVRQYYEVWTDINELWFLGMQTLSFLLQPMPWIASFLAESGWPVVITEAFSSVSPNGIDANVKYTYEALLCPLVRISSEIKDALKQHNAIAVCQKHDLAELEGLLKADNAS